MATYRDAVLCCVTRNILDNYWLCISLDEDMLLVVDSMNIEFQGRCMYKGYLR